MRLHKSNILSYISIFTIILFLICNSLIVTYDIRRQVKEDLSNQFHLLNYESGQVIEKNAKLLDELITNFKLQFAKTDQHKSDLQRIFRSLTQNMYCYDDFLIILTDQKHKIIDSTGKSNNRIQNKINLEHRPYLQTITEMEEITIGSPITGAISHNWRIPIAKSIITKKKDFIGTIIISIPLSQFSKSIFSANINVSSISLNTEEDPLGNQNNIESIVTAPMIMKIAFSKMSTITVTEKLNNLDQNASFTVNAYDIRRIFWYQFLSHSIIAIVLLGVFYICLYFIRKKILTPITRIHNQLVRSAEALEVIIPEYRIDNLSNINSKTYLIPEYYSDSLAKIESFASSNDIVIETLLRQKNLIHQKDQRLSLLQRNFETTIKCLQENSKCLSEQIDDIIFHNKKLKKDIASKMFIEALEQIYNYSSRHSKRIEDTEKMINEIWYLVQDPKLALDFEKLIESLCIPKKVSFNINIDSNNIVKISQKPFYKKAVEKTLMYAISTFTHNIRDNLEINLNNSADNISIDITYRIINGVILDNIKLQYAIEKARLFALLDEGIVSLYHNRNKIIISIQYLIR